MDILEYRVGRPKDEGAMVEWQRKALDPQRRLYGECNEEGEFSGRYVVVSSKAAQDSGDLEALFHESTVEYLAPRCQDIWFDYSEEKEKEEREAGIRKVRYLEYEYWMLADDTDFEAYLDIIGVWFRYVVEHKKRLFDEWVSARYYERVDDEGNPTGGYAMVFEYASHEDFQEYKKRRRHSYNTNTGDYLVYRDNDPYQFFNVDTVGTEGLWPL